MKETSLPRFPHSQRVRNIDCGAATTASASPPFVLVALQIAERSGGIDAGAVTFMNVLPFAKEIADLF